MIPTPCQTGELLKGLNKKMFESLAIEYVSDSINTTVHSVDKFEMTIIIDTIKIIEQK